MQTTMRSRRVHLAAILIVLQLCSGLWALSMTAQDAETAANGWLRADARPLDTPLGQRALGTETFLGDHGKPAYYVVYLDPSGFVVVSADDRIDPIIAFADDGHYDPSPDNPLAILVTNDLNARIAGLRAPSGTPPMAMQATETNTQKKWNHLIALAEPVEDGLHIMGESPICSGNPSDVRVAPLTKTKWGQGYVYQGSSRRLCCNYWTPNNYVSGCTATAMAQLMYYHRHPSTGIGVQSFTVEVDGEDQSRSTRGGNGNGGAYKWTSMVLAPSYSSSQTARQAIGALCYDAGVAGGSAYTEDGTGMGVVEMRDALLDTFGYTDGVLAWNYNSTTEVHGNIGTGLEAMLNPNLDAEKPVILAMVDYDDDRAHAVVCDGYGYQKQAFVTTPYHHLNMGWYGADDCWYNLPDIACPTNKPYEILYVCLYNVFPSESGEIISGQVTDRSGDPISGADVVARGPGGQTQLYSAQTNAKGIYALVGLESNTRFAVTVQKTGTDFESQQVTTGRSEDGQATSGNRWDVSFEGTPSNSAGTLPRVLICGAEPSDNHASLADIQEKLEATGQFSEVGVMNVNAWERTPTLAELQAYDAVMVYSNSYYDEAAMGDVMADYVDGGGGVVCTMFEVGGTTQMEGRWATNGYYAISRGTVKSGTRTYLGTVLEPDHLIMQGVTSFNGGPESFRPATFGIAQGAVRIANWSDGRPLVATKMIGNTRRADLGFYPVSSDVENRFWDASTDGALLMANALSWVARADQPASSAKVLICGAEGDDSLEDIQRKLEATAQFSSVSIMNVSRQTPTLHELQAFDAVMVFKNFNYEDTTAIGGVMAEYVENGGGVVCTMFEAASSFWTMQGWWEINRYYAIVRGDKVWGTYAELGRIYQPGHPILEGVNSFNGGSRSYRPSTFDVVPGTMRVADWSDGRPLVVTKMIGNTRRVDLGFYPVSSHVNSGFWDAETDGALLMANALTWVAQSP